MTCCGFYHPNRETVEMWASRKMFDVTYRIVSSSLNGKVVREILLRVGPTCSVSPLGRGWLATITQEGTQ